MNSWEGYACPLKKCFIFVSFPPDITNCDKLLERRNAKSKPSFLPSNQLKHSTSATCWAKISTSSDLNPASSLTSAEEAVAWLEILAMKPAVRVRTMWDEGDPRPETFTSSNKIDNMSCSCRQTPCIDYHVKQHSWGTDLKTSQEKNADMRSMQEGVWFRTKARGNSEYSEKRMTKDTWQEIGQLLRGSRGVRWTEKKDFYNSVNYVRI